MDAWRIADGDRQARALSALGSVEGSRLPRSRALARLASNPPAAKRIWKKERDMKRQPRIIDLESWPRREHYEFFKPFPVPFFSITTSVDVAPLRKLLKARG